MYRVDGDSSGFRDALGESLTIGSNVSFSADGRNKSGKIVNKDDKDWIFDNDTKKYVLLSDFSVANYQVIKV